MKRSTDRTLVTHVGSLVRPMSIRNILSARDHGEPYDEAAYQKTLKDEVGYGQAHAEYISASARLRAACGGSSRRRLGLRP